MSVGAGASALLALIAACGGGESRSRKEIRGPAGAGGGAAQAAMKKLDPATAGTITGTVRWEGPVPNRKSIDVSGNPDCQKTSHETIYEEFLVVDDHGGKPTLRNAFVSIDTTDVYDAPAEPFVVDQVGCHYVPHVFAVQANQKLKIKSSDPTLHNVHYIPTVNTDLEDNFAMAAGGPEKTRSFPSTDWVKFKCEVHPWMGAWCAVRSHPFFAVTGEEGTFTIKNVPPGTHKLVVKHERLGEQNVTVTVETGKTTTQDFTWKQ